MNHGGHIPLNIADSLCMTIAASAGSFSQYVPSTREVKLRDDVKDICLVFQMVCCLVNCLVYDLLVKVGAHGGIYEMKS